VIDPSAYDCAKASVRREADHESARKYTSPHGQRNISSGGAVIAVRDGHSGAAGAGAIPQEVSKTATSRWLAARGGAVRGRSPKDAGIWRSHPDGSFGKHQGKQRLVITTLQAGDEYLIAKDKHCWCTTQVVNKGR